MKYTKKSPLSANPTWTVSVVYRPLDLASQPLPVYLFSNCYAEDALGGLEMINDNSPANVAAKREFKTSSVVKEPDLKIFRLPFPGTDLPESVFRPPTTIGSSATTAS